MAKKRLKRGFYSYLCCLWLFCRELNLRNLVISRVLATFVQSSLCLSWPGRAGLCPKMLKTRVLFLCSLSLLLSLFCLVSFFCLLLSSCCGPCLCECGLRLLVLLASSFGPSWLCHICLCECGLWLCVSFFCYFRFDISHSFSFCLFLSLFFVSSFSSFFFFLFPSPSFSFFLFPSASFSDSLFLFFFLNFLSLVSFSISFLLFLSLVSFSTFFLYFLS